MSQVYPLRVLSAFWLTADELAPLNMADTRGKRLSLESRLAALARPERPGAAHWGQLSHTLPRGVHVWLTATRTTRPWWRDTNGFISPPRSDDDAMKSDGLETVGSRR